MAKEDPVFLTRKQVNFEYATTFGLEVNFVWEDSGTVQIKGFTKEGPFTYSMFSDGVGGSQKYQFNIPDIPIMLMMDIDTDNLGVTYAKVNVYLIINKTRFAVLMQGTLNGMDMLSWPSQLPPTEVQQKGKSAGNIISNVTAGQDLSYQLGLNQFLKLKYVWIRLVTNATVANRRMILKIDPSNGPTVEVYANKTQTANQTIKYIFYQGAQAVDNTVDGVVVTPLPMDMWLGPESPIYTDITNLQVGDQINTAWFTGELYQQNIQQ